jgi:hypothetical protein
MISARWTPVLLGCAAAVGFATTSLANTPTAEAQTYWNSNPGWHGRYHRGGGPVYVRPGYGYGYGRHYGYGNPPAYYGRDPRWRHHGYYRGGGPGPGVYVHPPRFRVVVP